MTTALQRPWLSPFLAVTFLTVSLTGILLLFHQKIAAVNQIHQWGGLLFLAGGGLHWWLNRRPFTSYFKDNRAFLGAIAGLLMTLFLVAALPFNGHGEKYLRHGGRGQDLYWRR